MSPDAKAFLELCRELRQMGALVVCAGEMRAEFGPVPSAPSATRKPDRPVRLTEDQRAEDLRIERAKELSRV
jgi:hypothetical protein